MEVCYDFSDLNFVQVRSSVCGLFNQSLPTSSVMYKMLGWKLI